MDQATYEAIRQKLREKQRTEEDALILMQEVINELKRRINEGTGYKCCTVGHVDKNGNFVSELDGSPGNPPTKRARSEVEFST